MNGRWSWLPLLLVFLLLPGCGESVDKKGEPSVLKLLVLPDRAREQLTASYAPLIQYLSRKLNRPCELIIPSSYEEAIALFHARTVQLANLGGIAFVKARAKDHAVPLVMRE